MKPTFTVLLIAITLLSLSAFAQTPKEETFTIEGYYRVKWGYQSEFLELYKKNHYPLLKKAIEKGDLLSIKLEKPLHHATEESRWDYRITLVFKNVQAAFDPNLTEPYKKTLYPDQPKFKKEESRRFEILDAHWDVSVGTESLDK
ncbi:hypothetical protein [Emticicia sp. 21SJ11W-3]|uniref:hypothetical protein n=1 Tax=Emticicia sp. 21SJ11W-3 TaxID=2916755 RepID=UPI00209DDC8A|nr:hypothetical protein [Emticicia sp. 21SJ11W-3]UTA66937.1 hypothetical protein MB380_15145 [Emticicia sp. 21SJ11W-3]